MKYRVLVLVDLEFQMPEDIGKVDQKWLVDWKTEYDVIKALEDIGHEIRVLGGVTELGVLRECLTNWKPHIVFNLLEEFFGQNFYVAYLLGYFELIRQPFTGCSSSSILLASKKPLAKQLLAFHRIPMPHFKVFPMGRRVRRPQGLDYPLIVKSTTEHGSEGISQASIVTSDDSLRERVEFIHTRLGTDAMAEQYIDGREVYVGVLGNRRLETLPIWEVLFTNLPEGAKPIATSKIKWDMGYRAKVGVQTGPAQNLLPGVEDRLRRLCKRVSRILGFCGYARMDFRLCDDGSIFLLECNPNPDLGRYEDYAESALSAHIKYEDLIDRVLTLGLRSPPVRPLPT